jgi:hypothetical protein
VQQRKAKLADQRTFPRVQYKGNKSVNNQTNKSWILVSIHQRQKLARKEEGEIITRRRPYRRLKALPCQKAEEYLVISMRVLK